MQFIGGHGSRQTAPGHKFPEDLRLAGKAARGEGRTGQHSCERREQAAGGEQGGELFVFPQLGERFVGAFTDRAGQWWVGSIHLDRLVFVQGAKITSRGVAGRRFSHWRGRDGLPPGVQGGTLSLRADPGSL